MTRLIEIPSVELLRDRYALDPFTGKFIQRKTGKTLHGYITRENRQPYTRFKIVWNGHSYGPSYSRAVFAWFYGYWPENVIKHYNENGLDNRPWNLYEVKAAVKSFKPPEIPTKPVDDGVWCAGPRDWQASVKIGSNVCWVGSFVSHRQAALGYRAALRLVG